MNVEFIKRFMNRIFNVKRINNWVILERSVYPRLKVYITCDPLPKIMKVDILDPGTSQTFRSAIDEINGDLIKFSQLKYN